MRNIKNFILAFISAHLNDYSTPGNLNYLWSFGSVAAIFLVIQIYSGIFLSMHYCADVAKAFDSVEHIMRDVQYGWAVRYIHSNGASLFFIITYLHIFKNIYYGSYMHPREKVWYTGVVMFLLMMATAFIGYVLPWGQMSLWGATVITNLFSAVPFVGDDIVKWLWGGYSVSGPTLYRFYTLHYLLPFIIAGIILSHLSALHGPGSNNPLGIDTVPKVSFYPSFFVKDVQVAFFFFLLLAIMVTWYPNALGHPDNYIPADPLITPAHIVPEWYFLPFYAVLRSIPDKLGGVVAMISAVVIWLSLPIFNQSEVRCTTFRPLFSLAFWLFVANFFILGWVGQEAVEEPYITIGMYSTLYYFFFFFSIAPLSAVLEKKMAYYKELDEDLKIKFKK
jgi:ubiquinol-cytochrome c reductase cytochrome b subunit